jgi:uncharacterized membrane protein (UPF0127 family)
LGERLLVASVARTTREQARGLQDRPPLRPAEGMLFPMCPRPRAATFHMGRVAFPIDLLFADEAGVVQRIVHNALPGARDFWSLPICGAVLELAGGFARAAGIEPGIRFFAPRRAEHSFDLLRTLTEASVETPSLVPPLGAEDDANVHGVGSTKVPPLGPQTPPEARFRDHRLPDEAFSEGSDQPWSRWEQTIGYDPTNRDFAEGLGPALRMGQAGADILDPGTLVATVLEAMARRSKAGEGAVLAWRPDTLNVGATEHAVVTAKDLDRWLKALPLDPMTRAEAVDRIATPESLETLGDGMVLAGMADLAQVSDDGQNLVLFRGTRPQPESAI